MGLYHSIRISNNTEAIKKFQFTPIGPAFWIREIRVSASKRTKVFVCECSCGNVEVVPACLLKSGVAKRCRECYIVEVTGQERDTTRVVRGISVRDSGYGFKIGDKRGKLITCGSQFKIGSEWRVVCECDCGNVVVVSANSLRQGKTTSCRCFANELTAERSTLHGYARRGHTKRIYRIFRAMKNRCRNPNSLDFKYYGGRGIKICDDWSRFESFRDWAFAHGYTDELTIDRIDPDGEYCPANCQWVTRSENSQRVRYARQ